MGKGYINDVRREVVMKVTSCEGEGYINDVRREVVMSTYEGDIM